MSFKSRVTFSDGTIPVDIESNSQLYTSQRVYHTNKNHCIDGIDVIDADNSNNENDHSGFHSAISYNCGHKNEDKLLTCTSSKAGQRTNTIRNRSDYKNVHDTTSSDNNCMSEGTITNPIDSEITTTSSPSPSSKTFHDNTIRNRLSGAIRQNILDHDDFMSDRANTIRKQVLVQ